MSVDFSSYANMTGLGNVKFPTDVGNLFTTNANLGSFSNAAIKAAGTSAGLAAFSADFPVSEIMAAAWGGAGGWTFITTPEDISWSSGAEVTPIKIFGTNQTPVTVGSKSMRDLTMGGALVEGFSRSVQVEDKVAALEALMNFSLVSGPTGGYVKVPVFQVTANNKVYGAGQGGADGGYYVIKDIKVKETIRDLAGMTTRATVDVTFTQIPPYQVSSGIDAANKAVTGAKATALGTKATTPAATVAPKTPALAAAPAAKALLVANAPPARKSARSPSTSRKKAG